MENCHCDNPRTKNYLNLTFMFGIGDKWTRMEEKKLTKHRMVIIDYIYMCIVKECIRKVAKLNNCDFA